MRNYLVLVILFMTMADSYGQVGFYKNIYGDYNEPYSDKPQLNSISKLSDGRYFVTGHSGAPFRTHFGCTMLDENFNILWSSSYEKSPSGSSNFLQFGVELTDKSIVSIGVHNSKNVIVRHDENGNLMHSKYYGTDPAVDYSTGALCASTLDDTGYVAMFAQCAIQNGIFKFDKDGEIVWAYEYGSGGNPGSIYEIEQALYSGYISTGITADYSGDTTHNNGFVLLTNDDGTFKRAKKYAHPSNDNNYISVQRVVVSEAEDCYYASCNYGATYPDVPLAFAKEAHILQLDSSLNIMSDFQISSPDTNVQVYTDNIATSADNTIIITGRLRNSEDYPSTQFFILKLNPYLSGGDIVWCKVFWPLSTDADFVSSYTLPGLFTYGPNNDILTSLVTGGSDQGVIASIDVNGEGLCVAEDKILNVTMVDYLNASDLVLTPSPRYPSAFPLGLTAFSATHKDTMLCYINTLETPEAEMKTIEIVSINYNETVTSIKNLSAAPVNVDLFSITGQLVQTIHLGAFEQQSLSLNKGLFVYRASQNELVQKNKFIMY